MFLYRTSFELTANVNDIEKARTYLTEDDMTKYLRESIDFGEAIGFIEWVLMNENSGYITLIANRELSSKELREVSEWVSGQNSDGLGEGFEQQDFAWNPYMDEWDDEYEDYSDDGEMASFDWTTNKYKFELVSC